MTATPSLSARSYRDQLAALGVPIERLTNDSRQVQQGDIFVAYPGERFDGRDFIDQAVAAGAGAVLWEAEGYEWPPERTVPNLAVRGLRSLAGRITHELAGEPSHAMWMIGVTGTNGKTSCSQWIAAALTSLGKPTAVIGTLGHGFPGELTDFGNTTPDAISLHPMLAQYRERGARCVAMEVSSHGLVQERLSGVHFNVALFTNLTRDHLDYHGDMQSYGEAKARLFDWPGLGYAVINVDDSFGRRLVGRLAGGNVNVLTYGLSGGAISGHRLDLHRLGLDLEIRTPWGTGKLRSRLLGAYNAVNLLGVLGVLLAADVPFDAAVSALAGLTAAEGRMQTIGGGDRPVIVIDYAHTPDALEQVLTALRAHLGAGRLVCVFGCGGDRDAGKRPAMGEIAARLADAVFVTSDNPRSEDPAQIIADVVAGIRGPVTVDADRRRAIAGAIRDAQAGDVVLIAGKGHERWQEIGAVRYPFNDAAVAAQCLDTWSACQPSGAGSAS